MINLIFIRHGATEGNLQRRYIGRTDEPLCALGRQQAESLKELFSPDMLFASPMLRTRQTAEIIFPGIPMELVEDMRETDFGIFEGKTAAELEDDEAYKAWLDSMCLDPIPEGESVADFKTRCCRAFEECVKTIPDGSTAAFVVHGGVIMAVMECFGAENKSFYDYHIKNGEYIICTFCDNTIKA